MTKIIEVTDEFHMDMEPFAYLVKAPDSYTEEYKVFANFSDARRYAGHHNETVFPLWPGHGVDNPERETDFQFPHEPKTPSS